jgi:ParB family chromosome partitioning protein
MEKTGNLTPHMVFCFQEVFCLSFGRAGKSQERWKQKQRRFNMSSIFQKEKTINRVVLLPAAEIEPNPAQPRTTFDRSALNSLAESIRQNGILQPLTVRKNRNGRYELIAGERRLRAARIAGLSQVPAIILQTDEKDSAVLALLENLQREDLNFFEQATALVSAIVEWNVTQEEAALRLSMAQSTIANKIRLTRIPKEQQQRILEGGLTERHARALLKISDDVKRANVIEEVVARGYNVSQTEKFIDAVLENHPPKMRIPVVKDVRIFLNTINKALAVMKSAGIPAESEKKDEGAYIEYIVRIPKT